VEEVEDAEPPRTCTVTAFEQMCSCQKFWVSTRVVESGSVAHTHSPLFLTSCPSPPTACSHAWSYGARATTARATLFHISLSLSSPQLAPRWQLTQFVGLCAAVNPSALAAIAGAKAMGNSKSETPCAGYTWAGQVRLV
jgi:hypothetical protein